VDVQALDDCVALHGLQMTLVCWSPQHTLGALWGSSQPGWQPDAHFLAPVLGRLQCQPAQVFTALGNKLRLEKGDVAAAAAGQHVVAQQQGSSVRSTQYVVR
jgi:hypothetical protein